MRQAEQPKGKEMKRVTIKNDFHHTSCVVVPKADGRLSASQIARCRRALCGIAECTCGGALDERGSQEVEIDQEGIGSIVIRPN